MRRARSAKRGRRASKTSGARVGHQQLGPFAVRLGSLSAMRDSARLRRGGARPRPRSSPCRSPTQIHGDRGRPTSTAASVTTDVVHVGRARRRSRRRPPTSERSTCSERAHRDGRARAERRRQRARSASRSSRRSTARRRARGAERRRVCDPNCIVARRALRYLPHTPLTVIVEMLSTVCAGRVCDPHSTMTCVEGQCARARRSPIRPHAERAREATILGGRCHDRRTPGAGRDRVGGRDGERRRRSRTPRTTPSRQTRRDRLTPGRRRRETRADEGTSAPRLPLDARRPFDASFSAAGCDLGGAAAGCGVADGVLLPDGPEPQPVHAAAPSSPTPAGSGHGRSPSMARLRVRASDRTAPTARSTSPRVRPLGARRQRSGPDIGGAVQAYVPDAAERRCPGAWQTMLDQVPMIAADATLASGDLGASATRCSRSIPGDEHAVSRVATNAYVAQQRSRSSAAARYLPVGEWADVSRPR